MTYPFRAEARNALNIAKTELATADDARLRFAALQLRLALEALTYERAQMYQDELPPSEIDVWQPGKVIKVLIEIEPHTYQNATYRIRREASETSPAGDWMPLGHDVVIPMKEVQKHHSALSSALHMPTIKQLNADQGFNPAKIRSKCEEAIVAIEKALCSTVRTNLGHFQSFDCGRCSIRVRRRLGVRGTSVEAECYGPQNGAGCGARYTVFRHLDDTVEVVPHKSSFGCTTEDCGHIFDVWTSDVKEGASWTCPACAAEHSARFRAYRVTSSSTPPESAAQ